MALRNKSSGIFIVKAWLVCNCLMYSMSIYLLVEDWGNFNYPYNNIIDTSVNNGHGN